MRYVADTHALIFHTINKLPKKSDEIFRSCEEGKGIIIYIPTIVLAESYYLVKHGKVKLDFDKLLNKLENSYNYSIISFNIDILKLFMKTKANEIHDRIIVATTKYLDAILITKDGEIRNSEEVKVVW
ncbi:MAG: PIN domain-containing protein [Nitrospirota bacterium]